MVLSPKKFEEVIVHPNHPDQKVQIGMEMPAHMREDVTQFLSTHLHNFAWCTQDMLEIEPSILEHSLSIDPIHKSIKQKPWQFGENMFRNMKSKVEKLLWEIDYPS